MIHFLDILSPGESREDYLRRKQKKENQIGSELKIIKELEERNAGNLVEEQPQLGDETPILEHSDSELTATGVAGLAVVLLLGAALVAMRSLSKK